MGNFSRFRFSEKDQVPGSGLREGYGLAHFGLGIGCAGQIQASRLLVDLTGET